jgi:hypothetical protein
LQERTKQPRSGATTQDARTPLLDGFERLFATGEGIINLDWHAVPLLIYPYIHERIGWHILAHEGAVERGKVVGVD